MNEQVFGLVEKLDDLKVFADEWTLREVTVLTPPRMVRPITGLDVEYEPGDERTVTLVLDRRFPDEE